MLAAASEAGDHQQHQHTVRQPNKSLAPLTSWGYAWDTTLPVPNDTKARL